MNLYISRKYGILINFWRFMLHIGAVQRRISFGYATPAEEVILLATGEVEPKASFELGFNVAK